MKTAIIVGSLVFVWLLFFASMVSYMYSTRYIPKEIRENSKQLYIWDDLNVITRYHAKRFNI